MANRDNRCETMNRTIQKQKDVYRLNDVESRLVNNTKLIKLCKSQGFEHNRRKLEKKRKKLNDKKNKIERKYTKRTRASCEVILKKTIDNQLNVFKVEGLNIEALLLTAAFEGCNKKKLKHAANILKERRKKILKRMFDTERRASHISKQGGRISPKLLGKLLKTGPAGLVMDYVVSKAVKRRRVLAITGILRKGNLKTRDCKNLRHFLRKWKGDPDVKKLRNEVTAKCRGK